MSAIVSRLLLAASIGAVLPAPLLAQATGGGTQADTVPAASQRLRPYTGMLTGGTVKMRPGTLAGDVADPDVLVVQIEPGSPSETAGLHVGDAILEVDGVNVHSGEISPLARLVTGVSYLLRVRRGEQELELTLVPGPLRPTPRPRIPR